MNSKTPFSLLYPILDAEFETPSSLPLKIIALARAGCQLVQLRAKNLSAKEFMCWAEMAVSVAHQNGIALVINDRADIALFCGADGLHVGQEDMSISAARRVLGSDAIIGVSTHTVAQASRATQMAVDYVAIGPAFVTSTKLSKYDPLGINGIRNIRAIVDKPLVAIGGINLDLAPSLLEIGIDGLAVVSALTDSACGRVGLQSTARKWLSLKEVM